MVNAIYFLDEIETFNYKLHSEMQMGYSIFEFTNFASN